MGKGIKTQDEIYSNLKKKHRKKGLSFKDGDVPLPKKKHKNKIKKLKKKSEKKREKLKTLRHSDSDNEKDINDNNDIDTNNNNNNNNDNENDNEIGSNHNENDNRMKNINEQKAFKSDFEKAMEELTPAERLFLQRQREREIEQIGKIAKMTHREKIELYNQKLSELSEHHDIPKVGPG